MNEWMYIVCVCAFISKKKVKKKRLLNNVMRLLLYFTNVWGVRCAVFWFRFRFSFIHTYHVFSNHNTFFSSYLCWQYSWQFFGFFFFFILVRQPRRHNNFPPDRLSTWLLRRHFLNAHLTASDLLWISMTKLHCKINFVLKTDYYFPYVIV